MPVFYIYICTYMYICTHTHTHVKYWHSWGPILSEVRTNTRSYQYASTMKEYCSALFEIKSRYSSRLARYSYPESSASSLPIHVYSWWEHLQTTMALPEPLQRKATFQKSKSSPWGRVWRPWIKSNCRPQRLSGLSFWKTPLHLTF